MNKEDMTDEQLETQLMFLINTAQERQDELSIVKSEMASLIDFVRISNPALAKVLAIKIMLNMLTDAENR